MAPNPEGRVGSGTSAVPRTDNVADVVFARTS